MVGGFNSKLFTNIDIDVTGLSDLIRMTKQMNSATKATRRMSRNSQMAMKGFSQRASTAQTAAQNMGTGSRRAAGALRSHMQAAQNIQTPLNKTSTMFDAIGKSSENAAGGAGNANKTFGKMFGVGMNLMFMGMALQKMFGGLAKSMLKTVGTSQAFGAAAKSVLLPFFAAIAPKLNKIAFFFMELQKPIKMAIGAFVAIMAVFATFLFFGAQVGIMAATISGSFVQLAASILMVLGTVVALAIIVGAIVYTFQRFGTQAGILATVLGVLAAALLFTKVSALAASSALLGPLAAAFTAVSGFLTTVTGGLMGASAATAAYTAVTGTASSVLAFFSGVVKSVAASTYLWASANTALLWSLSSIMLTAGSLVLGLLLLNRVFKKFGPIVGFLATIIGGVLLAALSPVAAIIFTIYGAFKAVTMILKKFSGIVKVAVAAVIAIIAVLVAVFVGTPLAIAAAVGAILAIIWSFKDEIIGAIQGVINFIMNLPKHIGNALKAAGQAFNSFVAALGGYAKGAIQTLKDMWNSGKKFVGNLIDFILNIPKKIMNGLASLGEAMIELGVSMVDGVVDGLESVGDKIADTFWGLLPGPIATAVKGISTFSGDLISRIQGVFTPNDFILTSDGKMIQPAANDTIIGTKNPENLGGGGGGEVTVNINDPVMKEEADVERLVDEVEERVNRDSRGRSGGL